MRLLAVSSWRAKCVKLHHDATLCLGLNTFRSATAHSWWGQVMSLLSWREAGLVLLREGWVGGRM